MKGMYTITCKTKTDGGARCTEKVEPGGLEGEHLVVLKERSVAQLDLIKPVQDKLEDVTAVFYFEDVPWQFVGYDFVSPEATRAGVHFIWREQSGRRKPHRVSWQAHICSLADSRKTYW